MDAGRGVAEALRAAKIPPSQPDVVLLTSLLPENMVGLDDLLAASVARGPAHAGARDRSARYGRSDGARSCPGRGGRDRAGARARRRPRSARARGVEVAGGAQQTLGGLTLRAGALAGGPVARARVADRGGRAQRSDRRHRLGRRRARGARARREPAAPRRQSRAHGRGGDRREPRRSIPSASRARPRSTPTSRRSARSRGAPESVQLVLIRMRQPAVLDLQVTTRVDDEYDGPIAVAHDGDEFTP